MDLITTSLYEVRKNISIIPQEPTIFSGTIRKNLDPFDTYSDEEIWSTLVSVGMKEKIVEMEEGELTF